MNEDDGYIRFVHDARSYADRFRNLESKLRGDLSPMECIEIEDQAGQLIIHAVDLAYLPKIDGLKEIVEWSRGIETLQETRRTAKLVRCPANVFVEVVGGHLLDYCRIGGRNVYAKDSEGRPKLHGGILPAGQPDVLRLPTQERRAETCKWLAELIEDKARAIESCRSMSGAGASGHIEVSVRMLEGAFRNGAHSRNTSRLFQDLKDEGLIVHVEPRGKKFAVVPGTADARDAILAVKAQTKQNKSRTKRAK
jgi:hypothetical protein